MEGHGREKRLMLTFVKKKSTNGIPNDLQSLGLSGHQSYYVCLIGLEGSVVVKAGATAS